VQINVNPSGLLARAPIEPLTKLQKEIEVRLAPTGSNVRVIHRIANRSPFPLEFAAWALTMMAPGGMLVTCFPRRGRYPVDLEASNPLVMWAYTDLTDPRWTFTKKYLTLQQDPNSADAQKLGLFNPDTWALYLLNGEAFLKRTKADPSKTYPDFGCSFETFTNNEFLEAETVGPLTKVLPGQAVELQEKWALFHHEKLREISDAELDRVALSLLEQVGAAS
jgi:hypothetical protein